MPDISLILTLTILTVTITLFIYGKLRIDLIAISALVALLLAGVLTPEQGLLGFANQCICPKGFVP